MIKANSSDRVHIEFSADEYRALIEMVLVADWVMTCYEEGPRESTNVVRQVRRTVLADCDKVGLGDSIIYDADHGEFYETLEYEENAAHREFIDEYDQRTFWDTLVEQLVHRDLVNEFGEDGVAAMSVEERLESMSPREERYFDEFAKHGIANLRIGGSES
jgi:hypothetical protein